MISLVSLATLFLIVERPYYIVAILVFLTFYVFNIETPLPTDVRGILILILFLRLCLFDKDNLELVFNKLFLNMFFWLILIFLFAELLVPIATSGKIFGTLKEIILSIVILILGFITLSNEQGRMAFLFGILSAGILSSFDVFFTFTFFRDLNIVRILDILSGNKVILNHNYPGFLAGVSLIYIYLLWVRNKFNRNILVLIAIILSAGVLLSTSRSTLLALLLVFILLHFVEKDLRTKIRIIFITGIGLVTLIVGLFMIYELGIFSKEYRTFSGKFYFRLFEEPMQAIGIKEAGFNQWTGERLGGSVKFRSEKWAKDLDKFFNKDLSTQFWGLGPGGYSKISEKVYRASGNVRYQLAAHNGYLIIMFERGYFGLILYLVLVVGLFIKYTKVSSQNFLKIPVIYLIVMVLIYSFGQNSELISRYMYLAFGGLLSDLYVRYDDPKES